MKLPLIVDKDKVRSEILEAFERCIEEKPIFNISLRDIAKKAGMSHPKLLNYFPSKHDLVAAYCRYTRDYMTEHCRRWFSEHRRADFPSNLSYLNAFIQYVAEGNAEENRPNATVQTYVLAKYDAKVADIVRKEFQVWQDEMERCLVQVYGTEAGRGEAEAMMTLITGIFTCNYVGALTGNINDCFLNRIGTFFVE